MADRVKLPLTQVEYLQAPTGGWSPDVPAWELPADEATNLENFQIKAGKIRVRPPYRVTADLSLIIPSSPTNIGPSLAGWYPAGAAKSVLSNRQFVFGAGYDIEPQNVHRVGVSVPGSMFSSGSPIGVENAVYIINGNSVTRSVGGTFSYSIPGSQAITFNSNIYAISYAGAGTVTFTDGIAAYDSLLVVMTNPLAITAPASSPLGATTLYGHMNRIFVLGGAAPGGSSLPPGASGTPDTNNLFFTNPIDALSNSAADWTDPVSGLYNLIRVDGDYTDPGVALASVPAGLIILRQNTVFILRGTDPSSYVLRPVSRQAGCIDARSVVELNSSVYFMSDQGLMVTDGTRVQNVSGALQDELYRQVATWNNAVFNSTGAYCTAAALSDGKILITFGTYTAGSSVTNYQMVGQFSAVYDPATGAWVKVSTAINPTASASLGPVIQGSGRLQSLGNDQVLSIEDRVQGTVTTSHSSLHDVSSVGGAFTPITAQWTSRSANLALGGRLTSHLKRFYLDHAISTGGATGTVSIQIGDRFAGTTLQTVSKVVSTNTSDPRQSLTGDNSYEIADLAVNIILAGTSTGAASVNKAEVHGIGVEYQAAYNMPRTV